MIKIRLALPLMLFLVATSNALTVNIPQPIKPFTSIVIKRVADAATVYSLNGDEPRLIASNVKLFTTAFALSQLKPDFRWQTRLYYSGSIKNHSLNGNLYVVGGGDPTLDSNDMYGLLAVLKDYGITKITGNVVLDGSIFNQIPKYSFLKTDPYDSDTILPSGLMINHQTTHINLTIANQISHINSDLYGFKLSNKLQVDSKKQACDGLYDKIHINKKDDIIELSGIVPASCNNKMLSYRLLSNFAFNRSVLYKSLADFNISLAGDVVSGKCDIATVQLINTYTSASLLEVLNNMNRHSDNLIAETCLLSVGAFTTTNHNTYSQATQKFIQFLLQRELISKDSTIENGAGLSRFEFFTANQVTRLLLTTYHSNYQPYFMATLPVPGQDGSLKDQFKNFSNNLYAKTGTLNDTVALAGYFRNRFGVIFAFSIAFNQLDSYSNKRGLAIDDIIEGIFKQLNSLH
jgi:D-alanyl-D-alanine carboxypeptidase/D-alanyl-D-alanine-endopeptidase (penicillin-binding protein 4)